MPDIISSTAHEPGLTCLAFSRDGTILYTGGQDCVVRLWKAQEGAEQEPDLAMEADSGVTSLTAATDYWVSGSDDTFARQYKGKSTEYMANITGTNAVPIRCVAADPVGKQVAVASDELTVKIIDLENTSKVRFLTGHKRGVRRVTWHPTLPLLTTSSSDGAIIVWDISQEEPTIVKILDGLIPQVLDPEAPEFNHDCSAIWHPSGEYFVVATKSHEVITVSKSSWEKKSTFSDDKAIGEVTALALSANGVYLATASKGIIHIWSTQNRKHLFSHPASSTPSNVVSHLAFSPSHNILAWTDTSGAINRWMKPIPSGHPDPVKVTRATAAVTTTGAKAADLLFEDVFQAEVGGDDDVDDADMAGAEEDWIIDDLGGGLKDDQPSRPTGVKEMVSITRAQPPFQPGSTPMENKKRYLAYNLLGVIEVTDQDTHNVVNVELFDKSARTGFHFSDHFKYNVGYLGERGVIFGCQPDGEQPAQVLYRPFTSWNSNMEWTYTLGRPGTKVLGVACGGASSSIGKQTSDSDLHGFGNVTIATSENDLTFLSGTGRERRILGLGADFVTMVASVEWVFVVHRAGSTTIDGSQNLSYSMINFEDFSVRQRDILPIPKGSTLKWVGLSEEGAPLLYDSAGYLHMLTKFRIPHHASWARILDTNLLDRREGKDESYWPVGLLGSTFMCLILKGRQEHPSFPRPLVQELPVRLPFRRGGEAEEKVERELLLLDLARDALGEELTSNEIVQREIAMDKEFLNLMRAPCRDANIPRAIELAKLLHHTKSFDAAIKMADFYHLVGLKEKLQILKQDREEEEEDRLMAARDKRVSWSRTDKPLRQIQYQSNGAPTIAKPFQNFGPPPAVHRPGLAPATPLTQTQPSRLSMAAPGPSSLARSVSPDPILVPPTPEGKRKRIDESQDSISTHYKRVALESDPIGASPMKKANPFARKAGQDTNKNPFARKPELAAPIKKSESFFQKVDAAEMGTLKPKKAPAKGKDKEKDKKEGPRQTTLLGMMAGGAKKSPLATPSSESQETEVDSQQTELVETQRDEMETQQTEVVEESQFEPEEIIPVSGRESPDWGIEEEFGAETVKVDETQLLEAKF